MDEGECPGGCGWVPRLCHCAEKNAATDYSKRPIVVWEQVKSGIKCRVVLTKSGALLTEHQTTTDAMGQPVWTETDINLRSVLFESAFLNLLQAKHSYTL